MPLAEYQSKRKFEKTPEPSGEIENGQGPLKFYVQKHNASNLHYDFRLELNGVLKSWALPKGPTMNPEEKHLAVMVEDHPLDYGEFEGVIPEGNYGAGPVMLWDEGEYHSAGSAEREGSEKELNNGLEKGHLSFVLSGDKLKGEFALVRLKRAKKQNAWLLIKANDEFAKSKDIAQEDRSIKSGKTTEEITKGPTGFWNRAGELALDDLPRTAMPRGIKPMMATLADEPFDHSDWTFEIKWDGYRTIGEKNGESIRLYSRNNKNFTQFPEVEKEMAELNSDIILDGEIVVLNDLGVPDFQLIQNYGKEKCGRLVYYVFDLLYLAGRNLMGAPLSRRRAILKQIIPPEFNYIKISDDLAVRGRDFFELVKEKGMEGIMAKEIHTLYEPGVRSKHWLKIKTQLRQEAVIGALIQPEKGRPFFSSLGLGVYEGEKLVYIGSVGSGFSEEKLKELHNNLKHLERSASPFINPPKTPAIWLRPELVCEIKFQEWTREGLVRQPVFLGIREDKDPKEVIRERIIKTEEAL